MMLRHLTEIKWKFLTHNSYVRVCKGAECFIPPSAIIRNCRIIVMPGCSFTIGNECRLDGVTIFIGNGQLTLDNNVIIQSPKTNPTSLIIDKGTITCSNHSKISCRRVWVRFGGKLSVGSYTNINEGSEIRCDNNISIGSYNQISYNVRIWDTNTHNIMPIEERRLVAEKYFPYYGYELTRPKTAPIFIGDDCWIGENSVILKGSTIGNGCVIGYGTFISGKNIHDNCRIVTERSLRVTQIEF